MVEEEKWEMIPAAGNFVLQRENYFISYNPSPVINLEGRGETALCFADEYFILNGDHRSAYEQCKSLKECVEVFKNNSNDAAFWSCPSKDIEQIFKRAENVATEQI